MKKGAIEISMSELVVLVVVAVGIAVGLVPVLAKFLSPEIRGVDQGTRTSMYMLKDGVDVLTSSNHTECYVDFGLQEDIVFVGFGHNRNTVTDTATERNAVKEYLFGTNSVTKPQQCAGYACIVICDVGGWTDWGEDDVDEADCISRPRSRPFVFEKVSDFVWQVQKDSQLMPYDLVVYSNHLKYGRLALKKERDGQKYKIYVREMESQYTEQGETMLSCQTLKQLQEQAIQ